MFRALLGPQKLLDVNQTQSIFGLATAEVSHLSTKVEASSDKSDDFITKGVTSDHYENIYVVIQGTKDFTLLPPCASSRLHFGVYPHAKYSPGATGNLVPRLTTPLSTVEWSPVDFRSGEKWPQFHNDKDPPPLRCSLGAGELLYLPSMWYHHVALRSDSGKAVIALNFWSL